jgi:hypothetical protein
MSHVREQRVTDKGQDEFAPLFLANIGGSTILTAKMPLPIAPRTNQMKPKTIPEMIISGRCFGVKNALLLLPSLLLCVHSHIDERGWTH